MPFDPATAAPLDPGSLALSRSVLDRAADRRRDDRWLARVWDRPDTQVVAVVPTTNAGPAASGRIAVTSDRTALAFTDPAGAPKGERVFLGVDRARGAGQTSDGRAVFAVLLDPDPDAGAPVRSGDFATLREAGAVLDDREAGIAVHAIGLANWHAFHPRCARCGALTDVADAGHTRACPACGAQHFPRSDPAIIVLVTDGEDRVLLGRQDSWPPGRFSTLAGFVEPGESLEAAVRREVLEETGVVVGPQVRYVGSQPWPFPSSLMLGFYATAVETAIDVDGDEITEAHWFTRAELRAVLEAHDVRLPGAISISRRLIEAWYGSELPV